MRGCAGRRAAADPRHCRSRTAERPAAVTPRAARDLQSDLSRVAGARAGFSCGPAPGTPAIIAGTLGHSRRIERIVRTCGINTDAMAGRWEARLLQVVERPEPGVPRALLIAGADKCGTIYGLYEVSRRIGVSPWTWWADVPLALT